MATQFSFSLLLQAVAMIGFVVIICEVFNGKS